LPIGECVCIYIYIYVFHTFTIYIHIYIYIHTHIHIHLYNIHTHTHTHTHTYIYIYIYIYIYGKGVEDKNVNSNLHTKKWLDCELQRPDPDSRQRGRPRETGQQIPDRNSWKGSNIWSNVHKVDSTPRHTDWLTVSSKVTLALPSDGSSIIVTRLRSSNGSTLYPLLELTGFISQYRFFADGKGTTVLLIAN
jgi:hypothetical protein